MKKYIAAPIFQAVVSQKRGSVIVPPTTVALAIEARFNTSVLLILQKPTALLRTITLPKPGASSASISSPSTVPTVIDDTEEKSPEMTALERKLSTNSNQLSQHAASPTPGLTDAALCANLALQNTVIAMHLGNLYDQEKSIRAARAFIFEPEDLLKLKTRLFVGCATYKNSQHKPAMEDAAAFKTLEGFGYCFVICDGHGVTSSEAITPGKRIANFHARNLPEEFQKQYLNAPQEGIEIALVLAFDQSDKDGLKQLPESATSGTTAVMAFIPTYAPTSLERFFYIANCGDSRAILCTPEGLGLALSLDHDLEHLKPSEKARVEAGGVLKEGRVYPQGGHIGLNMSRTLGNTHHKKAAITHPNHVGPLSATPDIYKVPYTPGDKLILACDGIWNVLKNSEIAELIKGIFDRNQCVSLILEEALKRGARDNLSVQVIILDLLLTAEATPSSSEPPRQKIKKGTNSSARL